MLKIRSQTKMIDGKLIKLVPATLADKENVYIWCFHSETTKSHSGPPYFPETPIESREEFFKDNHGYSDYFFDGTQPKKGRGFIILFNDVQVGFVSYTSFHLKPGWSELDIWINSEGKCNKGFGSDALITLSNYLNKKMNIDKMIMRPSVKNDRAINAYVKAGFEKSDLLPQEYMLDEYLDLFGEGDYGTGGDQLLVKRF